MRRTSLFVVAAPLAVLLLQGCASSAVTSETAVKPAAVAPAPVATPAVAAPVAQPAPPPAPPKVAAELYEVYKDGRIYRFYDFTDYRNFLKIGEAPFRLTQIGAGPAGETVVYDLAKADKEKTGGIPSVELVAGNIKPDIFYGEMVRDGRIYVFDGVADMAQVRQTGQANLRFSDIGGGPNGESVIYVLNEKNKEKQPVELMAAFKAKHGS